MRAWRPNEARKAALGLLGYMLWQGWIARAGVAEGSPPKSTIRQARMLVSNVRRAVAIVARSSGSTRK